MNNNPSPVPEIPVFLRRLGPDPHAHGAQTPSCNNCPDILELSDGNFAVIGIEMTARSLPHLPPTVGCGPDERVVWIPRSTLVKARGDIPTT
jgi:hypothetical protein